MPQRHLDPRLFDKFLRGEITLEEVRDLAWHLVESCPDCAHSVEVEWSTADLHRDRAGGAGDAASEPPRPSASSERSSNEGLDEMFDRLRSRVSATAETVQRDRAAAPVLVEELLRQPPARQRLLVHNNSRYHTLPLAELLLDSAWERGFDEPAGAELLAELALEVVDRIDVDTFGEEMLDDVRGRAWGLRGNFRRILADLPGAKAAFAKAHELLATGTGDLLERARLLTLESTLLRLQARLDEAAGMLDETIGIYRALDETHLVGRTMISQALLENEAGDPETAIGLLREAQSLLEPEREPHLVRLVQNNLVGFLSELGRYEEAMRLMPALRARVVQDGTRTELLRLRWQEGKIHLGLGNEERAEAAFLEVRKGFVDQGLAYDAAAVSLQLAALYTRQRRTPEIRELAAQMFPIFQSRDLHQEAIAALLLFQRAVEMDTLTLRMVEEVADVVRRSQHKPRPLGPEPS